MQRPSRRTECGFSTEAASKEKLMPLIAEHAKSKHGMAEYYGKVKGDLPKGRLKLPESYTFVNQKAYILSYQCHLYVRQF